MGQSSFKWVITYGDCTTQVISSTPEGLPDVVDFTDDIVSIVRVDFS